MRGPNSNRLHFLQVNLYNCKNGNVAFDDYVAKYNIDIILAQEPYIVNGCAARVPSHWPYFFSNDFSACILLTNKDFICINSMVTSNTVNINLNVENEILIVGSQYSPPSGDINEGFDSWINCFQDCADMILGNDFNVQFQFLVYKRDDEGSQMLSKYFISNNFSI